MNEITIYGTPTCGVCKMLCKKLDDKKIEHTYIQDMGFVMKLAEELGISSVPIIEVDGQIMDMMSFSKKFFL